ncbi:MAG: flagellar basal-body rod protein FlgG [Nitrospiria bacterium]
MNALMIASTGMSAQQLAVETIANNLANMSTTGFKKSVNEFQDLIYQTVKSAGTATGTGTNPIGIQIGTGVKPVSIHKIFSQGDFTQTGNPLDIAIQGDGFLQVSMPDGTISYTRSGSLQTDSNGNVVTADGYQILPAMTIPNDAQSITISPQGLLSVIRAGNSTPVQIGTIDIARFPNEGGLSSIGQNLYKLTTGSGDALTGVPGLTGFGTLLQGSLENSNVNIAEEMVNMIVAQRAYEVNSKAIQTSDDMMAMVNNLKQN